MEPSFLLDNIGECWRHLGIHLWQILYLHLVRRHPGANLSFSVSSIDLIKGFLLSRVAHVLISGCPFTITFLLQAWRKYDSDRSGYIESNELKVKYQVRKCVTQNVNAAAAQWVGVGGKAQLEPCPVSLQALQHALSLINYKITLLYWMTFLKIGSHQY